MQNVLNCQVTSKKKMNMKISKAFPIFQRYFEKKISVDLGKLRAIVLNMAKIHKALVKKETSDVLSRRIILNG